MFSCEIFEIFKNTFFTRTPQVAVSEERVTEEVRNFNCHYDKGNRATKKIIRKRTYGLEWRMAAATTKIHKLSYKGNLDWLKRCSENFLWWLYLENVCYVTHLSKENEQLHHRLSITRKDPINSKWIPLPRILRESWE